MSTQQLLRRAWDALDSFRQAHPENWGEDDEQVLKDLVRTDLQVSGVKLKWSGLSEDDIDGLIEATDLSGAYYYDDMYALARKIEAKLKERNA